MSGFERGAQKKRCRKEDGRKPRATESSCGRGKIKGGRTWVDRKYNFTGIFHHSCAKRAERYFVRKLGRKVSSYSGGARPTVEKPWRGPPQPAMGKKKGGTHEAGKPAESKNRGCATRQAGGNKCLTEPAGLPFVWEKVQEEKERSL